MWIAIIEAEISQLKGQRKIAIVTDIRQVALREARGRGSLAPRVLMNAPVFEEAEDLDYLITKGATRKSWFSLQAIAELSPSNRKITSSFSGISNSTQTASFPSPIPFMPHSLVLR